MLVRVLIITPLIGETPQLPQGGEAVGVFRLNRYFFYLFIFFYYGLPYETPHQLHGPRPAVRLDIAESFSSRTPVSQYRFDLQMKVGENKLIRLFARFTHSLQSVNQSVKFDSRVCTHGLLWYCMPANRSRSTVPITSESS